MNKDYTIYELTATAKYRNGEWIGAKSGEWIGCYGLTKKEVMKEFTKKYYRKEWNVYIQSYKDRDIWESLMDIKKNGKCTETSF